MALYIYTKKVYSLLCVIKGYKFYIQNPLHNFSQCFCVLIFAEFNYTWQNTNGITF